MLEHILGPRYRIGLILDARRAAALEYLREVAGRSNATTEDGRRVWMAHTPNTYERLMPAREFFLDRARRGLR